MIGGLIIAVILAVIFFVIKNDKIDERKKNIIIHTVGIALIIFALVAGYLEMKKNSDVTILLMALFVPAVYYTLVWFMRRKKTE